MQIPQELVLGRLCPASHERETSGSMVDVLLLNLRRKKDVSRSRTVVPSGFGTYDGTMDMTI